MAAVAQTVNIHEAKARLSRLVSDAEAGGEVVIARAGAPVVRLVPVNTPSVVKRRVGFMRGQIRVPDDFDTWMQDEIVRLFEDGETCPTE